MKDLFWSIFAKSGNIDAFLAYKEFSNTRRTKEKNINIESYKNFSREISNF